MIYAENQNVKTTPYKPPEGEAGRKFPRQYSKPAAVNSKATVAESNTASQMPKTVPQPSQDTPMAQQCIPSTQSSPPDGNPQKENLAPVSEAPAPDTQQPSASAPQSNTAEQDNTDPVPEQPQQQVPRSSISEWANPPETATDRILKRLPDRPINEASDAFSTPAEPPAEPVQPLTLEQEEAQLEAMEGGPISSDQIDAIPDLTPPGLTLQQAQEYPSYYEDASDLRDAQPGPMADERIGVFPQEAPMDSAGTILVQVFTARQALPIVGARVTITHGSVENTELISVAMTDRDGRTRPLEVPTPAKALSEAPSSDGVVPFAIYDIRVEKTGYYTVNINDVQVFSGEQTLQGVDMTPLAEFADPQTSQEDFTVLPQNL